MLYIYVVNGIEFSSSDELDLYLLYKYLVIDFRKQGLDIIAAQRTATDYIEKYKTNLWGYKGLAYSLGARNLEFFCLYFLQDIFVGEGKAEIAPIHSEIWVELQEAILNKDIDKLEYLLPRGTGKSTFISLPLSIWCSVYKYRKYTVIASAIGDTASTFIKNIRLALDGNKKIEKAFGELFNSKKCVVNTEQIELTNRTMIQSISASSTLRGKSYGNTRIELLLLDDYQKDDEVATHDQREKKWKKFNDDVKYAIQKNNCTMIAVGTVQHQECFYNRLKNLPTWRARHEKGVLTDDVDELFNSAKWLEFKSILFNKKEYGENSLDYAKEYYFQNKDEMQFSLLWESFWDCLDMAISYYENPVSFKQEVQGDTSAQGERRFKTIITESAKEIEEHDFINTMLCLDPASTVSDKSDYSAFVVGSKSVNNIKYMRKSIIAKLEILDMVDKVIELLKEYEDITHVYIEKNLYRGADVIRIKEKMSQDPVFKGRYIEWINETQHKNKVDKIDGVAGDVNLGRVIFNEEDTEPIDQLTEYVGVKSLHDDYPDVLAECINRLDVITPIRKFAIATGNPFRK